MNPNQKVAMGVVLYGISIGTLLFGMIKGIDLFLTGRREQEIDHYVKEGEK